MSAKYQEKLNELLGEEGSWRRCAYAKMQGVPEKHLATYGRIATLVEEETGRSPGTRNIAWLRKELYRILSRDTAFPLHRIAKAGDVESLADSNETKACNDKKRGKEGSLTNPQWI